MAFASSLHLPRSTSLHAVLAQALATFKEARARRAQYLRVLAELSATTDRELADLGISPLSIRDIAYQAAYGA